MMYLAQKTLFDKLTLNNFIRKEQNFTTFFEKGITIKNQVPYYNSDGNIYYIQNFGLTN